MQHGEPSAAKEGNDARRGVRRRRLMLRLAPTFTIKRRESEQKRALLLTFWSGIVAALHCIGYPATEVT